MEDYGGLETLLQPSLKNTICHSRSKQNHDPNGWKLAWKSIIEQMRNEGKTLLVSTHIIDSVDMLWDRTIIMQDGQIRANLTREELERDGRTLEQLFFDVTEGIGRDAMSHTEDSESQGG